ncbi:multidrug effflux MFS transporter [Streptomyces lincolnensis]|uniref:multidrug effflux MFS transporter n=1 Tax=Streptomyces lincolnensis TaxID=1915 RepID=UPI001E40C47E|nr:multidrug effflux MFS transporter [Streptomyces lincolnensis]MCD7440808.1 multidrug effflux MFS transporter [Streptomyces lincolnensis]
MKHSDQPGPLTADPRAAEHARPSAPPGPGGSRAGLLLVLGLLTAAGPLAIDMYVPGFPAMGASLHTGGSAVQLTLTAFLAGVVVGQLVIGPLSDGLGRRRPLVAGCLGFALAALACALAPGVEALVAARFVQGVAGAAGMVLARAVILDRFHGHDVARYIALLGQILCVAPVVAPVIGGGIMAVSSWRAVFLALCVIGVLLAVGVIVGVPESLPPRRRHRGGLPGTFRAMGHLVRHRAFLGHTLVLGLSSAALFAYISGSSFVFERIHGLSAGMYAVVFAVNSAGQLAAGTVFSRLAHRVRMNTLLTCSVALATGGALAQVLLTATVGESLTAAWITQFVTVAAFGTTVPAAITLGQHLGRTAPGAASALLGGLQFLCGALASSLVGLFGQASSLPMGLIMLGALVLCALALLTLVRPWQGHGEVTSHRASR